MAHAGVLSGVEEMGCFCFDSCLRLNIKRQGHFLLKI